MGMIISANNDAIANAADMIKRGGLVAMPTETVYGLAADACNARAVAGIFAAKGRPSFNPLIVHINTLQAAQKLAYFNDAALACAQAFWPGPLTMILPRLPDTPLCDLVSAGLPTIALRVPAHPVARALIEASGAPIAAPSANASGTLSPTSPAHVAASLGDKVDMILAAGTCPVGLESTVLDLSGDVPLILRPGAITPDDFARLLGTPPAIDNGAHDKPRSPGQLLRHYAPRTNVRINAAAPNEGEAYLAFGPTLGIKGVCKNLSEAGDLHEAAANLFGYLDDLDKGGFVGIAVAPIPDEGLGLAINDRLRRASMAQGSLAG